MNEKIVQRLMKLQVDYEKSWADLLFKNNDYSLFKHEYNSYYQPLIQNVFPELYKHINTFKDEQFRDYYPYIKDEWVPLFSQQIRRNEMVGSQFLYKLSQDLSTDFSRLLNSYTKTGADHLKHHFLNQFFLSKGNFIAILIKNNPELGFKTIAKLKSPQLQFALINQQKEVLEALQQFFETCSKMESCYLIGEYCEYPDDIPVNKYYKKWVGGEFIHIKFCKLILGSKYEDAKDFIRQKNEFNQT